MTDDCKVVKQNNCKLVARNVTEVIPTVDCQKDGEKKEYKTCKKVDKQLMISKLTCEVKALPSCKTEVVEKVIRSTWDSLHELIQITIY